MTTEDKTRYWGVRMGEGGKFVEDAKRGNYIAIGWNALKNLGWLMNKERVWDDIWTELYDKYKPIYGGYETEIAIGIHVGIIMNFVRALNENDIVIIPDMANGRALVGRVTGSYEYKENWEDGCPYQHRRNVKWEREVKREDIPPKLKASLNVGLTIFNLERCKQEILVILGSIPVPTLKSKLVTGNELANTVIERLFDLDPEQFEHFVTHLLTLVGFEATTTQLVGDKGVDVIGTFNPEGLTDVTLRAQLKRVRSNIGIYEIQRLRGTLGTDEHGVFITTSGFTKQAREEAQTEGKKPIAIIDKEALADLILEHSDELDERYKQIFALSRREIPLRERFYMTVKKI